MASRSDGENFQWPGALAAREVMAKRKKTTKPTSGLTSDRAAPAPQAADRARLRKTQARLAKTDREILRLINLRAQLAVDQAQSGLTHEDRVASATSLAMESLREHHQGPLTETMVRNVFRELTSGCRRLIRTTRVAYLGPEHSYSHMASMERFGSSADLIPLESISAVFEEVASANADFGMVPLENSTDGRIIDTLNMFSRSPVRISGEVHLRIHHNLLGKGPRGKIKRVCSKPQAISQCRAWLAEHLPAAEIVETTSTTAAAKLAAKSDVVAAVASQQAATHYGLDVLAANIEDNKNNVTRFAILGPDSDKRTGNDKTALLFQVNHEPGALADAMNILKRNKLNLTWIESFPMHDCNNEYYFFAEFEGHEKDLKVRKAVAALQKKTHVLNVLGSYVSTGIIDE